MSIDRQNGAVVRSLTLDGVCQIFASNVRCNQMPIVVLHLPFVVDDILQFDSGTAVIMRARTADHNHISAICFIRILFVAENAETAGKQNNSFSLSLRLQNRRVHSLLFSRKMTYIFAKSASSFVAINFDESILVSRKYLNSFDK